MSIAARLVPRTAKGIAISSVFGLLLAVAAWQGVRAWWNYGFSRGTRTGCIRKLSYRGTPVCKYWLGELDTWCGSAAVNIQTAQHPEAWVFTTDASSEADPVIKDLQAAEASHQRVTLRYRQDRNKWWACAPSEYYVVELVKTAK